MLGRAALRTPARAFRTSAVLAKQAAKQPKKFLSPQELVEKRQAEAAENKEFTASLLSEQFDYAPKIVTANEVNDASKRPVPLNVELLQYKPLRHEQTHGDKVAEVKFRSFEEQDIIRASEFAARSAYFLGIPCSPMKTTKTEKRLYTVIRSPFAQAKSKENFHRVTYTRQLTAYDANPEVVDLWLSYVNKHAFDKVTYQAQVFTREALDFADTLAKLGAEDMAFPEAYAGLSDPIAAKVQELLKSDTFLQYLEK